jgi:hypothetical protein
MKRRFKEYITARRKTELHKDSINRAEKKIGYLLQLGKGGSVTKTIRSVSNLDACFNQWNYCEERQTRKGAMIILLVLFLNRK